MFFSPLSRRQMCHLCFILALTLLLCGAAQLFCWGTRQLDTGAAVCADTLRLHIRADSDSPLDQTAKLTVRDAILAYADQSCPAQDTAAAVRWAAENLSQLELVARQTLAELGIVSPVRVRLVEMYFDTTRYPSGVLPAGRYQAVRIDLGTPNYGKNWWCVLYPGLCRSACSSYDTPAENDLVCGEFIVRFRLVEWWQSRTASREEQVLLAG